MGQYNHILLAADFNEESAIVEQRAAALQATFAATIPSMFGGWGGTFARLDDFLATLSA